MKFKETVNITLLLFLVITSATSASQFVEHQVAEELEPVLSISTADIDGDGDNDIICADGNISRF